MRVVRRDVESAKRAFWAAVIMTALMSLVIILAGGCSDNQSEMRMTLETLKEIAQTGNVEGEVYVHLSGVNEAGMKEAFYVGSPGSVIKGNLKYRFSEKPTTRPAVKE